MFVPKRTIDFNGPPAQTLYAGQLRELIKSRMEPTESADTVLAYFKANEGKRFDKRHVEKLRAEVAKVCPTQAEGMRISLSYGMQHLEFPDGPSLLLSHSTKAVVMDPQKLQDLNLANYSARDERNERRRKFLETRGSCESAAIAINKCAEAVNALRDAMTELYENWYGHDMPLSDDSYMIEKVIGLK